mmetsp:Transcript_116029/g.374803  ORF Transcript_116029/g.374803 Transcript_116029/m.374803 type:complete len:211 (-) Transcript_116029:161-793(-)
MNTPSKDTCKACSAGPKPNGTIDHGPYWKASMTRGTIARPVSGAESVNWTSCSCEARSKGLIKTNRSGALPSTSTKRLPNTVSACICSAGSSRWQRVWWRWRTSASACTIMVMMHDMQLAQPSREASKPYFAMTGPCTVSVTSWRSFDHCSSSPALANHSAWSFLCKEGLLYSTMSTSKSSKTCSLARAGEAMAEDIRPTHLPRPSRGFS